MLFRKGPCSGAGRQFVAPSLSHVPHLAHLTSLYPLYTSHSHYHLSFHSVCVSIRLPLRPQATLLCRTTTRSTFRKSPIIQRDVQRQLNSTLRILHPCYKMDSDEQDPSLRVKVEEWRMEEYMRSIKESTNWRRGNNG